MLPLHSLKSFVLFPFLPCSKFVSVTVYLIPVVFFPTPTALTWPSVPSLKAIPIPSVSSPSINTLMLAAVNVLPLYPSYSSVPTILIVTASSVTVTADELSSLPQNGEYFGLIVPLS